MVAGHSFTYGIWEHRLFASSANFRRIRFVSLQLRLDAVNLRISRSKIETPSLCGVWSWAHRMVWRRWIWILALVLSSSIPMLNYYHMCNDSYVMFFKDLECKSRFLQKNLIIQSSVFRNESSYDLWTLCKPRVLLPLYHYHWIHPVRLFHASSVFFL